jgi:membrane fusion protein, multidrug efflux system
MNSAPSRRLPTLWRHALAVPGALAVIALAACTSQAPSTLAPRPVRVVEIAEHSAAAATFAGEVRARYETKVGFRVGGKIVRRALNVGEQVKAGQLIAELDPADYRLAADAVDAQLRAARADYDFAVVDLQRYEELLQKKFISPADYQRRQTSTSTLGDRVAALGAQVQQARLQTGYTRLLAEHDSVVVSLPAEVEQVVTAGQPVAVLARLSELEVAIDIPEAQRGRLTAGAAAIVKFWSAPDAALEGRVREVAASAEPSSRTYAVRVALPQRPSWVQIGMSATVAFAPGKSTGEHVIPLSAVFVSQGDPKHRPRVWALKPDGTVYSIPVTIGTPAGADEVAVTGLTQGLKIVTAGASRLREGDSVSILSPTAIGGSLASKSGREPSAGQSGTTPAAIPPAAARTTK